MVVRLLAVYFIALLIPLVTGSVVYMVQIRDVEQEILDSRARSLSLNKRVVESAILSINDMVAEVRLDDSILLISQLDDPLANRAALRVANAYNQSRLSLAMPEYVLDVVVYLKRPDLILTSNDIYFDTELYYQSFLRLPGLSYEAWVSELRADAYVHDSLSFETIEFQGVERETIKLQSSLPFTIRLVNSGTVTTYVDLEAVEELLATYLAGDDGFARITLPDGRRLASVGVQGGEIAVANSPTAPRSGIQFIEIEGREYAVSYIRSEANGWLYVSGTPVDVFFAQSVRIRILFGVLVLLLLLVGVPIVLLQVFGLSRPIAETSRILRDGVVVGEEGGKDPFSFISHSVDELVRRDRALKDLLDEQRPLVRGVVLERLFRGDFASHQEAQANLLHFGISVPSTNLAVFCILIEGYFDVLTPEIIGEFTIKSALIRDELEHLLPETALIHTLSHATICVALFVDDSGLAAGGSDPATVIDLVGRQSRTLRAVRCTVASGGVASDLVAVSGCIRDAIELAEVSVPGTVTVMPLSSVDSVKQGYSYPTDVELALVQAVRSGRSEETRQLVAQLRAANLDHQALSREDIRRLYRELDATRVKIVQRLPTDRRVPFDPEPGSPDAHIAQLLDYFVELSQVLAEEGAASDTMKASLERFVREHVFASEMGLKMLAAEFNLSEVYLSRLFPQLFGENFHAYVERIRMQQAAELLRSTRLTVEEIADRVGYQSSNSFRRVFKRTYGVSPSSFERSVG